MLFFKTETIPVQVIANLCLIGRIARVPEGGAGGDAAAIGRPRYQHQPCAFVFIFSIF